jgi:hypothetical protein
VAFRLGVVMVGLYIVSSCASEYASCEIQNASCQFGRIPNDGAEVNYDGRRYAVLDNLELTTMCDDRCRLDAQRTMQLN